MEEGLYCYGIGQQIIFSPYTEGAISNVAQVCDVSYSSVATMIELLKSICWLASFACGRLSGIARIEVLRGNEFVYIDLRSIMTEFKPNIEVICSDFVSATIIKFIEHSFDLYKKLRDTYLLNNLINIGVLAKSIAYKENKILLMSNFLEVLRYNYGLNVGISKGIFRQERNDFIWQTGARCGKRAYLKKFLWNSATITK